MVWEPINLSESCPNTQFAACTNLGYLYLSLLVQLYGDSADKRIQKRLEDEEKKKHFSYNRLAEEEKENFPFRLTEEEKRQDFPYRGRAERNENFYSRLAEKENENFAYRRRDEKKEIFSYRIGERSYKGDKDFERDNSKEEYDFIVVGAGAAGCVVANRLTEYDFNVLLLEAGPEQPDVTLVPAFSAGLLGSNIIWSFQTKPDGKSCLGQSGQSCVWPTGRVMGGGSSVNSMAYLRGNKLDYDTWAAMGNEGWSYRDVLPFFKKSEKNINIENQNRKYHGVDGEQPISRYPYIDIPSIMMTDAYHERGLPINDYNGEEQIGTMQAQAISQSGQRVSTNNAFIQPIRYKRKNLTVKVESLAIEVLTKDKRAYGVKYVKNGKVYKAFAKNEVIVSAGPVNTPKLLMLSGIGPKEHLKEAGIEIVKDLPVGYNLHDHVTFDGILIVLPNDTATVVSDKAMFDEVVKFKHMDLKDGPLSANGAVNSVAFIKSDPKLPAPDIQFQADVVQDWREYVKQPGVYKSVSIFPTAYYNGILPRTMNLVPKSRGRLYLNTTNIYAYPIIFANYLDKEEDLARLIKGVRFLLTLENTKSFKERGAYFLKRSLPPCEKFVWGSDAYISCLARSYTSTTYHPVGTCKMGPVWDKTAVVSPRLKVYGVERLRVIDSSIMPVVPRGNTNAPSIMVGERGVDIVLQDWLGENYCIDSFFI